MKRQGFTLMEILIVVIILGVLAGLAVPMFKVSSEKARKSEALVVLASLRQSQLRHFTKNGTYTAVLSQLDFDPHVAPGEQARHFDYAITSADTTGFFATATRNIVDGGDGTSTVTINQAGVVGGTL